MRVVIATRVGTHVQRRREQHAKMMHKRRGPYPAFGSRAESLPLIHSSAHVARSPHRRLQNDSAVALGVGRAFTRIPLLIEKPIVRSPRPSDFNECLLAEIAKSARARTGHRSTSRACVDQIELLAKKRVYTSTTRGFTDEAALPTRRVDPPPTTLERDADPVRCHRAVRYAARPAAWQLCAREWDAMQLRKSSDTQNYSTLPKIGNEERNLQEHINSQEKETKEKGHTFLRPMPGYGGFVPRHAVEPRSQPEADCVSDCMCSTARRTYRRFPAYEYKVLEYAHKGPFSKTVTMTHPLNPFNKVEHQPRIY